MLTFIAVIHVLVCIILVGLVLLQDPKGGAGSMFGGGSSNTLFGTTGAVTFLTRLTRYSAVIFGVTCLILTLLSRPKTGSVLDTAPASMPSAPATESTEAAPQNATEAEPSQEPAAQ